MSETKINKDRYYVKRKPIIFLYLDWDGKWIVSDSITGHASYYNQKGEVVNIEHIPNYVGDLKMVKLDTREIIYFKSEFSAGGSGKWYYLDFYIIENGKFKLLKTFDLWQRGYACFYNNAFYHAEHFEKRGAKIGQSYVYTCYLYCRRSRRRS